MCNEGEEHREIIASDRILLASVVLTLWASQMLGQDIHTTYVGGAKEIGKGFTCINIHRGMRLSLRASI